MTEKLKTLRLLGLTCFLKKKKRVYFILLKIKNVQKHIKEE